MLKLDEARQELKSKSYQQIQKETAIKWASRAAASFELCVEAKEEDKLLHWSIGEDTYHEALEHAILADEDGKTAKEVREAVHPYLEKAADSMSADPEAADVI